MTLLSINFDPLNLIQTWGYLIVFLSALTESLPLVGLFIPGQTIVILAGFIAKINELNIFYVFFLAFFGAVIGDVIGYLTGKYYGYSFLTRYGKYFLFKKEYYDKTKLIFNKHPGKTIIFGRFNSLTRAFAPFIGGSTEIPFLKFLVYDLIGCFSWSLVFVSLGYIFGKSYETALKYTQYTILSVVLIVIMIVYSYYLIENRLNRNLKEI